jgi:ion channel-forming bestrophin family protein
MKVYVAENFFSIIFTAGGSVIPKVLLRALLLGGGSGVVAALCCAHSCNPAVDGADCATTHALGASFGDIFDAEKPHVAPWTSQIGIFVGLLLVFKTNLAYHRIDLSTTLCGGLQHSCRTICSQSCAYLVGEDGACVALREDICRLSLLMMVAVLDRITEGEIGDDMHELEEELLKPDERDAIAEIEAREKAELAGPRRQPRAYAHVPVIAVWLRQRLQVAYADGRFSAPMQTKIDATVTEFLKQYQGLTKIATVPIPFPYAQMVKVSLVLFILAAPFFMVADYRWATAPLNFVLSVVLLGIDEIAVEIEDPFGTDANDIDLLPLLFKVDTDISAILFDRHRNRNTNAAAAAAGGGDGGGGSGTASGRAAQPRTFFRRTCEDEMEASLATKKGGLAKRPRARTGILRRMLNDK